MRTFTQLYNDQPMRFRRFIAQLFLSLVLVAFTNTSHAVAKPVNIVAFGDSLTAGLGVDQDQAYPAKLEVALKARGFDVVVTNAGVSGETTKGGLARLDWVIGDDVDIVIVELGANDALRGIDPAETDKNLNAIVEKLVARGKKVVIAGMLAPPNMGEDYGQAFKAIYEGLGKRTDIIYYPFFLAGVAASSALNQADGLHPKPAGYDIIVKNLAPVIEQILK